MKRVLYFLFVSVMVISMGAACSTVAAPTTAPAATTSAPATSAPAATTAAATAAPSFAGKTLYIQGSAIAYPGQEDAWNKVNADFTAQYGAKVVTNFTGTWDAIPTQLQTARMAGQTVDITTCGANQINSTLVRSGVIMDLTNLIKPIQDRWVDGMFTAYTIDGHIWALPWDSASTSVVFYNKTMFDSLGISTPKTYADIVAAAKVIEAKKPGVIPWIHEGKQQAMWPMWFMETFAQTSGNKSVQDTIDFLSGKRQFTSPEEVAAFAALTPFMKDGVLTQASLDTDETGMDTAFGQQKAAMMYDGTWELTTVRAAVNNAFEVGVLEFPMVVDTSGVVSQHGGGADSCLAIPSFAPQADLPMIMQYFEFITRADNANAILQPASPLLPVIKSVTPLSEPLASDLNTTFIPHTITFLDWIWPAEVDSAVENAIPAVITGQMTPEQAAASVQSAYDTLVKEKSYTFDWWTAWTDSDWAKVTPLSIPTFEVKN
jgi:raffinose/stachyose/melibiose transport system substrate-binding protein